MREFLLPIGLVALGILLIGLEVFVPSAGTLALLASISVLVGVSLAFYYGGLASGTVFLLVTMLVLSIVIYRLFKWWPKTSIGKSILIEQPPSPPPNSDTAQEMVGRIGKSLGIMLPGGYVEIAGDRYDAVAEVAVEDDQWVVVTGRDSGRILRVRPISEAEAQTLARADPSFAEADPNELPIATDDIVDPFMET